MQKKQKIPFTMDMKGTPRFAKFAILSMLLLAASQAVCQERIDEMRGCGNQTIVKCKDATHTVVCHMSNSLPYFSIVDENDSLINLVVFPSDSVIRVTDFTMIGSRIFMCGQFVDSVWFVGSVPTNGDTVYFTYFRLNNVSRLAKIQHVSSSWLEHLFVVGDNTDGDAILIECCTYPDPLNPIIATKTYMVSLIDTTSSVKYTADDLIVLDNNIIVSTHCIFSLIPAVADSIYSRLWFIENPLSPNFNISHINGSNVSFLNTPYAPFSHVYLEKANGTGFYASGTISELRLGHAAVSYYVEKEHRKTVYLSTNTSSAGIAYNPVSNNIEMLTQTRSIFPFPGSTTCNRVYSFNATLSMTGSTASGRLFSGYVLHSLASNPTVGNKYVITGEDPSSACPYFEKLIRYTRNHWGMCSSQISTPFTILEKRYDVKDVENICQVMNRYRKEIIAIRKGGKLSPICGPSK